MSDGMDPFVSRWWRWHLWAKLALRVATDLAAPACAAACELCVAIAREKLAQSAHVGHPTAAQGRRA